MVVVLLLLLLLLVVVVVLLLALRLGLAPLENFQWKTLTIGLSVVSFLRGAGRGARAKRSSGHRGGRFRAGVVRARPSLAPPRIPPLNGVHFVSVLLVFSYEVVRNSLPSAFRGSEHQPPVPSLSKWRSGPIH